MLQAFLVLPALALVYLLVAAVPLRHRLGHLLLALGSMLLAGGWWIAVVELWPASTRPYIGGSQTNSDPRADAGLQRLRPAHRRRGRLGRRRDGLGHPRACCRMLGSEAGTQVGWLLPAALVLLVAGLWFGRRAPRTDRVRAGLLLWGGWLLATGLTFSFMAGIFHAYYTVALAPAIAAVVAIGAHLMWQRRDSVAASLVLAATVAGTTGFTWHLLSQSPGLPALVALARGAARRRLRAGPRAAWPPPPAGRRRRGGAGPRRGAGRAGGVRRRHRRHPAHRIDPDRRPLERGPGRGPGGGRGGGGATGGLLQGSEPTTALTDLLLSEADTYTWVAATTGANSASGYQLATEQPVLAIGGFNGSDPSPTLAQFQQYVADGQIHYYLAGAGGGPGAIGGGPGGGPGGGTSGGGSTSTEISTWVADTFESTDVDGVTVYDLSGGLR